MCFVSERVIIEYIIHYSFDSYLHKMLKSSLYKASASKCRRNTTRWTISDTEEWTPEFQLWRVHNSWRIYWIRSEFYRGSVKSEKLYNYTIETIEWPIIGETSNIRGVHVGKLDNDGITSLGVQIPGQDEVITITVTLLRTKYKKTRLQYTYQAFWNAPPMEPLYFLYRGTAVPAPKLGFLVLKTLLNISVSVVMGKYN